MTADLRMHSSTWRYSLNPYSTRPAQWHLGLDAHITWYATRLRSGSEHRYMQMRMSSAPPEMKPLSVRA